MPHPDAISFRPAALAITAALAISSFASAARAQTTNDFFIFPSVRTGVSSPVLAPGLPRAEFQWSIPVGLLRETPSNPSSAYALFAGISLDLGYAHTVGSGEPRDMWSVGGGVGARWWIGGELFAAGLVGSFAGASASGVRVGARVTSLFGFIGTEISYDQFGGGTHAAQEVRAWVFVDVAVAAIGLLLIANRRWHADSPQYGYP